MNVADVQVSVVVAVHNGEDALHELLASLARQDFEQRYEVIVSDDGSTDATATIARSFAGHIPLVLCESAKRRGPAAAMSAGAALASGQVLAFCDHDDVVHEAWVRSLSATACRERLVAGAIHRMKSDRAASGEPMDTNALIAYYGYLPWSMTANLGVWRDVFDEVGGFTEVLQRSHDADLCWRLAARGVELAYEPAAIVFKRPRSGAMPTFRQYLRYGLDHPLLFRRHRDHGMPRRSPSEAAWRYAETAVSVATALRYPRSPSAIPAAARAGQDLGRLVGSIRWRTRYL